MNSLIAKFIFLFCILCGSFTVSGAVYKCEQPNGKVTYQAKPCSQEANNDGKIDLKVNKLTKEQINAATKRLDTAYRHKEDLADKRRQQFLDHLEVQKANAATRQANATYQESIAKRKETTLKLQKADRHRPGELITIQERNKRQKKWNKLIDDIK